MLDVPTEIKSNNSKSIKNSIIKDKTTLNKKQKKQKLISFKNNNIKNTHNSKKTENNTKFETITPIDNNTKTFSSRTANLCCITRKKFNHRITKRHFSSLKRATKTNNLQKERNTKKETYQVFLNKKLSRKYNMNTNKFYSFKKINEILYSIPSRFSACYKEAIINCDENEFLTQFYKKKNAKKLLHKLFDFYTNFSVIFPNYMSIPEGIILNNNIIEKQKMIDKLQRIKEIEENNKNKINKEDIIFTTSAMDFIFTDNSLKEIMSLDDDKIENENVVNIIDSIKKYEYNIIPKQPVIKKSKKNFGFKFSFVESTLKKNKSKNISISNNNSKTKNRNNSFTNRSQNLLKKSFLKHKILNCDLKINDIIFETNHVVRNYGTFRKVSSKQKTKNINKNKNKNKKSPSVNCTNNKITNHSTMINKNNYNINKISDNDTMKSNYIYPKKTVVYTINKRNTSHERNTINIDSEKIKSKLLKKIKPRENKLQKNMMSAIITDIKKRSNRNSQNITSKKNIMLYKKQYFEKNTNRDFFNKNIVSLNFTSRNLTEEEKNISTTKCVNTDRNNYSKENLKNHKIINSFYNNNSRLTKIPENKYKNFNNSVSNNMICEFNIRDNFENKNNYSIRKYYKNVKNIKLNEKNMNKKKKFNVTKEKSEGKKNTVGYDYDSREGSRNLHFVEELKNISKKKIKDNGNCNRHKTINNIKNLNRSKHKNQKKLLK